MMRRWRGPLGGAVTFLVVALLVIGGLAWVTVAALRVEEAQQSATAEARLVNQLRVALWRLDSGLITPLGLEDGRPYEHYSALSSPSNAWVPPGSNPNDTNVVTLLRLPSPLVSTPLHEWMALHFQLDPQQGWQSPQVPAEPIAKTLIDNILAYGPATNVTPDRSRLLSELRARYPVKEAVALLAARESSPATDPLSLAFRAPSLHTLEREPEPQQAVPNAPPSAPQVPPGSSTPPLLVPNPITVPYAVSNSRLSTKAVQEYDRDNEFMNRAQIISRNFTEQKQASENGLYLKNMGNNAPTVPQAVISNGSTPTAQPAGNNGNGAQQSALPSPPLAPVKGVVPSAPVPAFQPSPAVVHLGTLRPHWLKAKDGTEQLALVRSARVDNRVVYQGILLDWHRLQNTLLEEVRDLFPTAALVPVRDSSTVSTERTMTALPVQLEPGVVPETPSPRWTPLRIGLALAWTASLIALLAVGLGGWSILALSERRIRFVSAVTHELRTPLTSLRLYLDLLTSGLVTDETKRAEYLATLSAESDRLHRLIDNVLDFARLENRPLRADKQAVPVAELLRQIHETWAGRCATDGRELVLDCSIPGEKCLITDPRLVQQVVGNLIDNARKYTRDAEDKRIWLRARPGAGERIVIEVEDRGPGIPLRERSTVFRPFRRGETADTTAGGAGLGLSLARQWAEALGGRLTFQPAPTTGACFRLELP